MPHPLTALLHHAEAVDPDLVDRIRHAIDDVTGFDPGVIVLLIGFVIVLFPLLLLTLLFIRRRHERAPLSAAADTRDASPSERESG